MKTVSIKIRLFVMAMVPFMVILALMLGRLSYNLDIETNIEKSQASIKQAESLAKVIYFMQIERGLSVGFVASEGVKNRDKLPDMRSKVDTAMEEAKKIYGETEGDMAVFELFGDLAQKREQLQAAYLQEVTSLLTLGYDNDGGLTNVVLTTPTIEATQ